MDWTLECANDKYACKCVEHNLRPKSFSKSVIDLLREKRHSILCKEKQSSWSFQYGMPAQYMQSRMTIVPRLNQISNIGYGDAGVHSSDVDKLPRGLRTIYNGKKFKINFPLKCPKYVVDDNIYAKKQGEIMGSGFWRKYYRKCERILYCIIPALGR